ncbi:hypothetical protein [Mechercharimyces sp. CAU 1602]|uniref:hypothetical protein n=1 Tax=Mechercharimyces sp. CAU 1602 TaxID=2973933 RepID=UPI0021630F97|nr:hypothetical protein [Mechercharimyces sp. CAU 1602]MCS1352816.1 hypothetical protein [Mechercharimyces sp. CAU 1602]
MSEKKEKRNIVKGVTFSTKKEYDQKLKEYVEEQAKKQDVSVSAYFKVLLEVDKLLEGNLYKLKPLVEANKSLAGELTDLKTLMQYLGVTQSVQNPSESEEAAASEEPVQELNADDVDMDMIM